MTVGESLETSKCSELQEQSTTPCDSSDARNCPVLQGVSGTFRVPDGEGGCTTIDLAPGVRITRASSLRACLQLRSPDADYAVELEIDATTVAQIMLAITASGGTRDDAEGGEQ